MDNWKEYHIKDLGTVITGNTPPTTQREYYGNEYKFIKPTDMIEGQRFVDSTEECLSDLGYQKYKKSLLPKFTPCVVTIGSLGKKMCLTDCECFTNQAVNAVIPNKNNDGIFLYYAFKATVLAYVKQLDSGTSSGRENVSKSSFSNIKITVPPLPTQQKIAGILSKYDEAIENNNKRIKLLEQMAQNLYKEWFVRFRFPDWQRAEFENGIPKGWKVEKLGNLFERLPFGRTYKKEDLEKEGSVIVIDQSTDDYLGFHNDEPAYKANFESPMILFGDHTCKFVLMTRDFSLGENIIPIKPRNCNPYYLFRSIDGIIKTTEYKRHWSILITQKIFIPSENLQNKFGEVYRSFIKQIENLTQQTQNLSRQRDLLLPRLMSGKLQVFRK